MWVVIADREKRLIQRGRPSRKNYLRVTLFSGHAWGTYMKTEERSNMDSLEKVLPQKHTLRS